MRKRYQAAALRLLPRIKATAFAPALRESLAAGYGRRELARDVLAGVVVGLVALPLSMALGIAAGASAQAGLYTAIIAGITVAVLGGATVQIAGPTASFVILAPIAAKYGLGGLAIATVMAGGMLVGMGLLRLGRLVQFIPHTVTTGFTSGIALVIAGLQLKDFFGLPLAASAQAHLPERLVATIRALPGTHGPDLLIGAITMLVLALWPRLVKRTLLPSPLVALALASALGLLLPLLVPGAHCATIASRFGGLPRALPMPVAPWHLGGPSGKDLVFNLELIRELMGPAFAIAMLSAIESLLTAVVSDGILGTRHDPDAELFAQGVGNVLVPFFGGVAATGAMSRTATCIRAGGRSPLAGVAHGLFVLVTVVALAPLLGYLPMSALAALLLAVAWNMFDRKHVWHILKVAPMSDVLVFGTCLTLTVVFDMVVAVIAGVMLAAILLIRRMSELASARVVPTTEHAVRVPGEAVVPPDVLLYEIAGPLLFGAAQKAMATLAVVARKKSAVILDLSAVPTIDMTGLVALESVIAMLWRERTFVILAGVQREPRQVLERASLVDTADKLAITRTLGEALELARQHAPRGSTGALPVVRT
jgi:SulP family sulfate permease